MRFTGYKSKEYFFSKAVSYFSKISVGDVVACICALIMKLVVLDWKLNGTYAELQPTLGAPRSSEAKAGNSALDKFRLTRA